MDNRRNHHAPPAGAYRRTVHGGGAPALAAEALAGIFPAGTANRSPAYSRAVHRLETEAWPASNWLSGFAADERIGAWLLCTMPECAAAYQPGPRRCPLPFAH